MGGMPNKNAPQLVVHVLHTLRVFMYNWPVISIPHRATRPPLCYSYSAGMLYASKKKIRKKVCSGRRLIFDLMSIKKKWSSTIYTMSNIEYNGKKLVILGWPFAIVLLLCISFRPYISLVAMRLPTNSRIAFFWRRKKNLFFLLYLVSLFLFLITQTIYLFIDFHRPFLRFISSIACDIRLSSLLSRTRLD